MNPFSESALLWHAKNTHETICFEIHAPPTRQPTQIVGTNYCNIHDGQPIIFLYLDTIDP